MLANCSALCSIDLDHPMPIHCDDDSQGSRGDSLFVRSMHVSCDNRICVLSPLMRSSTTKSGRPSDGLLWLRSSRRQCAAIGGRHEKLDVLVERRKEDGEHVVCAASIRQLDRPTHNTTRT
jgi:hypothetical protein